MANSYNKINIANTSGGGDAIDSFYDNTSSGLSAGNVQAAIDELAISVGASYVGNFLTGAWSLNVDKYELSIPVATHNKGSTPVASVYQDNAGVYEEVITSIKINGSGDITLTISSNPDLRFAGRVIIK
jgi:hypothetical protein